MTTMNSLFRQQSDSGYAYNDNNKINKKYVTYEESENIYFKHLYDDSDFSVESEVCNCVFPFIVVQ